MTVSQRELIYGDLGYEDIYKLHCVRSTDDPVIDPISDAPYYDEENELVWSEKSGPVQDYQEAEAYCESLNTNEYEGLTGWGLPDLSFFADMIDCEEGMSAFISPQESYPGGAFGGCSEITFKGHSAVFGDLGIFVSAYTDGSSNRYYADFTTGQVVVRYSDGTYYDGRKVYVRCVASVAE